ncbi:tRNA (cytosine(72)-C(5))-methyltransferase NSUN6 [Lucilia sericata]|uniref:tRNA (cytosine(72)-C(5))-methyltransferase NSUN6 n=1 Tax=Lucilia sericata TaxID=13632 RepID=UPI0018A86294|nr:tRNA (cytosine(72)-C(5))-methyltransferase NSUN6 [Lucilia sericata]
MSCKHTPVYCCSKRLHTHTLIHHPKNMFYPKSPFLRYPLVESQLCKGNLNLLEDLLTWLCRTPTNTTYRVNLLTSSLESFKTEVEIILKKRYAVPPKIYTFADLPELLCIGPTEISPKPDEQQKEIIVDTCCGAAVLRGAHIYAIGVLAMESGTKEGDLVNVYADLEQKCKKGLNIRYESNEKVYLGQGKVLMQRYQIYRTEGPQQGIAVEMLNTISGVPSIGDLSNSKVLLQNLPSIVCGRVLNPKQNELILDMCSAPGNKTTHLAELIKDQGCIIALDKTENKIKLVKDKIARNQLKSIKAYAFDSTKSYNEDLSCNNADLKPPFKSQTFDRILLDAPCSALGNRPLLSSNMSPKMLESYAKVQKKLFANAVPLLKTGGILVYSTCTVNMAENEEMVVWALEKFPELSLEPATPVYGAAAWPCEGLSEFDRCKLQRFGSTDNKMDSVGFFIAKFVKK